MIEVVLTGIIIALLTFMGYREKKYYEHIKSLEDKIIKANPQVYWASKNENKKRESNAMAQQNGEEVPIAEIPFMDFTDRDFNIQVEGDPETPEEARARGGK